jgi:CYTH domain-containing protein
MAIEIERRFLVHPGHSVWSSDSVRIVQGYIPQPSGGNLRVGSVSIRGKLRHGQIDDYQKLYHATEIRSRSAATR